MSNNEKTVVITGAGSGIGFAVAATFLRNGVNVVINGRNEPKLNRAATKFDRPDQLAVVPGDVTHPPAW